MITQLFPTTTEEVFTTREARLRRKAKRLGYALRKWRKTGDYGLIEPMRNLLVAGEPGAGWTLNDIASYLDGEE